MAVLEKIRERTVLILVLIGLALFAFVVDPDKILTMFNSNSSLELFGSINGEEIDQSKFSEYLDNVKSQYSTLPEGEQNKRAWDFLVNEKLIGSAASDLGLTVTPEELKELETGSINPENISQYFRSAIGNPVDDTSGTYTSKVQNMLANRSTWDPEQDSLLSDIEDQTSQTRLFQKYQSLIEKGIYTTNFEAIRTLNERAQNATVKYVSIPYPIEEIEISEKEIAEY